MQNGLNLCSGQCVIKAPKPKEEDVLIVASLTTTSIWVVSLGAGWKVSIDGKNCVEPKVMKGGKTSNYTGLCLHHFGCRVVASMAWNESFYNVQASAMNSDAADVSPGPSGF